MIVSPRVYYRQIHSDGKFDSRNQDKQGTPSRLHVSHCGGTTVGYDKLVEVVHTCCRVFQLFLELHRIATPFQPCKALCIFKVMLVVSAVLMAEKQTQSSNNIVFVLL